MSEHMKERRTESARVYLGVICHTAILDEVKAMLEAKGCAIREGKKNYTIEEVFPDFHAGHSLRGARYREDVSQRRLAKLTGVSVQNISAMENGRRPIGKDTAKRFAGVLNTDWRLLLS